MTLEGQKTDTEETNREEGHVMTEEETGMTSMSRGMPRISGNPQRLGRSVDQVLPARFQKELMLLIA